MATCLFPSEPVSLASPSSYPRSTPSSEKSCAPTQLWEGSQAKPPPPRSPASPFLRALICFLAQPSALLSLCWPRTEGESAGPPAPWGHGGLRTRARPGWLLDSGGSHGPPLHVAHAALILVTVPRRQSWASGPRWTPRPPLSVWEEEEPFLGPLTGNPLGPQVPNPAAAFSQPPSRTPCQDSHKASHTTTSSPVPAPLPEGPHNHPGETSTCLAHMCVQRRYAHLHAQAHRNAPTNTQY